MSHLLNTNYAILKATLLYNKLQIWCFVTDSYYHYLKPVGKKIADDYCANIYNHYLKVLASI